MRIILEEETGTDTPCAARNITYTRAHAHAYIPLGPPNNYSLYTRFMHLRALTDYFNEGNLGYPREKDKERNKLGECHVLHAFETSIGTNERTNGYVRLLCVVTQISWESTSIAVYTAVPRDLSLVHTVRTFARISISWSIDRRWNRRRYFPRIGFQVGHLGSFVAPIVI